MDSKKRYSNSSSEEDSFSSSDEQEKVGELPLKDDQNEPTPGIQSKRVSAFFGTEKYPAEYYFKETQRYIRKGQNRKAFLILDKFYERNKKEQFAESLLMKLGRRYLTAGLNVLHQYEERDELHTKKQTMILLKKLSTMVILWYQALIKILDRNRSSNLEFIIPDINSVNSSPNPYGYINQAGIKIIAGPSSFSGVVHRLEKEKRDEQKAKFKYPELPMSLLFTNLIDPQFISKIPDDVNGRQINITYIQYGIIVSTLNSKLSKLYNFN